MKNSLIKRLTSALSSLGPEKQVADAFELQICKIMIDSILDQLKNGDAEIVKKYKFQKINGLRIEGPAENEVNEMLKNAVMSVVSADSQIADEVIIPALLQ